MPVIMCTKFQVNQVIVTLFPAVWDKNPLPVVEKNLECRGQLITIANLRTFYFENEAVWNAVSQSIQERSNLCEIETILVAPLDENM